MNGDIFDRPMKILFLVSDLFFGEPIGALQLSAILKENGHQTRLVALRKHDLTETLDRYEPDVMAYSAMTPHAALFAEADHVARDWAATKRRRLLRIMGGPHPTYFPEVVNTLQLDAICIGEGDHAISEMVARFARSEPLLGIPNVLTAGRKIEDISKELILDLDTLPFLDKTVFFEAGPAYRKLAMRSIMTSRGCPYHCTYCHNHAFNKLFRGCGPVVRRRSVQNVLAELHHIVDTYQPVKLIKFCDDTFAHRVDDWLREFAKRYPEEIGLPFYCLMRSNTLTDEMANLLHGAGCVSVGMSVEAGDERIRNTILKRGLSNEIVRESFRIARKYGIATWGNTILAIPDTTWDDDFNSFLFTRTLKMTAPTFRIFIPYDKTELTEYAVNLGVLPEGAGTDHEGGELSPLTCFGPEEKLKQVNLSYLGTIFCDLPDSFLPMLQWLLQRRWTWLYKSIGTGYLTLKVGRYVFPGIYPLNPSRLWSFMVESIRFFAPRKKTKSRRR